MLHQEEQLITMDDIDVTPYIKDFEDNDTSGAFEDVKFSDFVFDNDSTGLSAMLDEYSKANNNQCLFDTPHSPVVSTDTIVYIPDTQMDNIAIISHEELVENDLDYDLYEETIVPQEDQQDASQMQEQMASEISKNPFDLIGDDMVVKEQPKADQRARYESDGPRFLPDSKKHPMSIQLPDLSSKSLAENESYGIILTMVTSPLNPKKTTFVHVNDIKYRTDDVIEMGYGSIFLPITKLDIQKCEKRFPRLSIICKKVDEYTFGLTRFDPFIMERTTETYTLANEDIMTKAAKGKQFTIDYDLLCYKLIFQLALKQDNNFLISPIKCETNIINEQKTPTQGVKRKASSDDEMSKKRKGSSHMPMINASKKSKSSVPSFVERPVVRTSNRKIERSKGSSVGSA